MANSNEIIQEALEKERKIKKLNSVLVGEFEKAIKTNNAIKDGQDVIVNFDIQCIPEDIRDLFYERQSALWGEISDEQPLEKRKYFYCKEIKTDGNKVTAKLIKNW